MVPSSATPSTTQEPTQEPTVTGTGRAAPAPRRRRRPAAESAPLGSLLQPGTQRPTCPACGVGHLTVLSLVLTDGTAVRFSSCRGCEHRSWDSQEETLSISQVLERSRA